MFKLSSIARYNFGSRPAVRPHSSFPSRVGYSKRSFSSPVIPGGGPSPLRPREPLPEVTPKMERIADETGVPADLVADPDTHMLYMRVQRMFDKFLSLRMGIGEDEAAQSNIIDNYTISPGYFTLEWTQTSPPPFHTFEELPLIKMYEGIEDH